MKTKVFIDGHEGTTGLRIHQRLSERPDIELIPIPEEKRKDPDTRKACIAESDFTFLCLPDAAAKESVELSIGSKARILDTSTAHRTAPGWVYGFPELSTEQRESVQNAAHLAVPGCHATGFNVLAYPLTAGDIAPFYYPFTAHSVTGYSGGGKKMIAEYESADRAKALSSPRQYGIALQHKHLPVMAKMCDLSTYPVFNPIVADYYSGMVVTVPVLPRLCMKKMTAKEMHAYFTDYYKDQKLIHVLPFMGEGVLDRGFVDALAMSGRDDLQIVVAGNDEQILLIARFDNLGKGASGAAVQCLNLMMGVEETTGLNVQEELK